MIDRCYSKRVSRPFLFIEKVDGDKIVVDYPVRKENENVVKELDVDQFSGQNFMLNSNGFICNDIMVFEEAQSDSIARAVLSRLKILHPDSLPQNLTEDEMFALVTPANYGSPAEFVSAHNNIKSKVGKLYDDALLAQAEQLAKVQREQELSAKSDLEASVPNNE